MTFVHCILQTWIYTLHENQIKYLPLYSSWHIYFQYTVHEYMIIKHKV